MYHRQKPVFRCYIKKKKNNRRAVVGCPYLAARCPPTQSSSFTRQGVENKDARVLLPWAKQAWLGENSFYLLPFKMELDGEKQSQKLKPIHFFILNSAASPIPQQRSKGGNGAVGSPWQLLSATPPFHFFPCSSAGSSMGANRNLLHCGLSRAWRGTSAMAPESHSYKLAS